MSHTCFLRTTVKHNIIFRFKCTHIRCFELIMKFFVCLFFKFFFLLKPNTSIFKSLEFDVCLNHFRIIQIKSIYVCWSSIFSSMCTQKKKLKFSLCFHVVLFYDSEREFSHCRTFNHKDVRKTRHKTKHLRDYNVFIMSPSVQYETHMKAIDQENKISRNSAHCNTFLKKYRTIIRVNNTNKNHVCLKIFIIITRQWNTTIIFCQ